MTRAIGLWIDEHPKTNALPPNAILLLCCLSLLLAEAWFIAEVLLS